MDVTRPPTWKNGIVACTLPLLEEPLPLAFFAPVFSEWPINEMPSCADLVYVPGIIWNDPTNTARLAPHQLLAWSKAARTTAVYGGVAHNQLESLLEQVNEFLTMDLGAAS